MRSTEWGRKVCREVGVKAATEQGKNKVMFIKFQYKVWSGTFWFKQ